MWYSIYLEYLDAFWKFSCPFHSLAESLWRKKLIFFSEITFDVTNASAPQWMNHKSLF